MSPYGKHIHIVGVAGTEGAALLEYLSSSYPKTNFIAHDYSDKKKFLRNFKEAHIGLGREAALEKGRALLELENVEFHYQDQYLVGIDEADTIFVPQSWYLYPQNEALKAHRNKFQSITKLYFDLFPGKIIGITGSNGKTTTSNLIAEIMKDAFPKTLFSGNDRRASQVLDNMPETSAEDWLVLEISNRQLMIDLGKSPDISIITNITPNHLHEYEGANPDEQFQAYAAGKASILRHQGAGQWALLNADDPQSQKLMEHHDGEVFPFSTEQQLSLGVFVHFGEIIIKHADREELIMSVDEFSLKGKHNLSNALAAIGACYLAFHQAGKSGDEMQILLENMATVLKSVDAVPQRLELVDTVDGVEYYNDSASTVPESTLAAVEALVQEGRKISLILGGKSKGSDYLPFAEALQGKVDGLAGIRSPLLEEHHDVFERFPEYRIVESLQEAVDYCSSLSKPGDVVLFSPAAEYFSYFRDKMSDYKQFRHMVRVLKG